jgi:tetratricopeptide (TPR) repeat protein
MNKLVTAIICLLLIGCNSSSKSPESLKKRADYFLDRGDNYLKQLNFDEAEYFYLKALKLFPTADIYVSLFRTYIAQDLNNKADSVLNLALKIDPQNKNATFIKAKYIFVNSKGKNITEVLSFLKIAEKNKHPWAKYLIGVIEFLEDYRKAVLKWDYKKLSQLTFSEATEYYYNSKSEEIDDIKTIFEEAKKTDGQLKDWEYLLPFDFYTKDSIHIITKIRSSTMFQKDEHEYQHNQHIILLTINSGQDWYSMSHDKGYSSFLEKYFEKYHLNKVFSDKF